MITTFSTNLLPSPSLYYNSHYEKFADGTVKCIDDEIPFDIPQNWSWCRLFAICTFLSRGKSPKYSNEKKYPVFAQKCNLKSGGISLEQARFLDPTTLSKWSEEYKLRTGDILVNSTGTGTVCRTRLFDNKYLGNYPFVVPDSHVSVVRTHHEIISDFICHYITSPTTQKFLENNLAGSTNQKELYIGILTNLLIPIPPKAEQERISKRISELLLKCASYDVLYNQLLSVESELQPQLKKSILQYAIQGKLVAQNPKDEPASELLKRINEEKEQLIKDGKIKREKNTSIIFKGEDNKYFEKKGNEVVCIDDEIPFEIPDSWEWVRMGDVGNWGAGSTPNRANHEYYNNGEILWLKTGELNDDIVYDTIEKITQKALNECSLRLNRVGDVLIAMYGATIGKIAIVGKELTTNQACCGCSPYSGLYNRYLFYYLMANKSTFIKQGEGGAQPNISRDKLVKFLIPLPPLQEQKRIVKALDNVLASIMRN